MSVNWDMSKEENAAYLKYAQNFLLSRQKKAQHIYITFIYINKMLYIIITHTGFNASTASSRRLKTS